MKKWGIKISTSVLLISAGSSLSAERIAVETMQPSRALDAIEILSISVEPFTGNEGGSFGFQIEERLESIEFDGQPYFEMVASRSAVNPDAVLSGSANSSVREYDTTGKKRVCVEKDENDKCQTYQDKVVRCLGRDVRVTAQVKLSDFVNGRTIYADEKIRKNEEAICDRGEEFQNSIALTERFVSSIIASVRRDFAPIVLTKHVKVLEKRKGMEKAFKKEFKASVKLTKRDVNAACDQWLSMSERLEHGSILYNLGICEERKGNLAQALSYYGRSLPLVKKTRRVEESIMRVNNHIQAKEDYAAREAFISNLSSDAQNIEDAPVTE